MVKTAFSRFSSWDSIHEAWKSIFRRARAKSRYTQGTDGICLNDFASDPAPRLREICKDLRSGRFQFNSLRPYLIPKPSGTAYRLICVPTVRDRIIQRALLEQLSAKYGLQFSNSISFGFVRGRTVEEAARRACELRNAHPWVFKTDITAFFDRIRRPLLKDRIRASIRDRSLHPLLFAATECEIATTNRGTERKIRKMNIREGLGVRQGMPLSPFFSNLLLQPLDREIETAKLRAVRYADDLIFFTDSRQKCNEIAEFCKQSLGELALEIPEIGENSKSQIVDPLQAVEFLGLGLVPKNGQYELSLLDKQMTRVRTELLQLGSIPELLARRITLKSLETTIQARLSGYLSAYECCSNIGELENELQNLHQMILRRLYQGGLGIDLKSLSAETRAFLNLS